MRANPAPSRRVATRPSPSDRRLVLATANRATTNALKTGPLAILKDNGYTAAKINAGRTLYTAADAAVTLAFDHGADQKASTVFAKQCEQAARGVFQDFAQTARAVFVKDKAALGKLGLNKAMPGKRADFVKAANLLFNASSYTQEMTAALIEVGWDSPEYSLARSKIAEYDAALNDQAVAKSEAQKSGGKQKKALKLMDDWMAKFIKIGRVVFKDENAQFLESILQHHAVHNRRQHPDIIGTGTIHIARAFRDAAKNIAASYYDGNFDA